MHRSYCSLALSHQYAIYCPCSGDHAMPLQPKGSPIGDWCQCLGQISIKISPLGNEAPVLKHGWYPTNPCYLHTWMKIQFGHFFPQIIKTTALSSPLRIPDCAKCLLNMRLFTNFAASEIFCFSKDLSQCQVMTMEMHPSSQNLFSQLSLPWAGLPTSTEFPYSVRILHAKYGSTNLA